MKYTAVIPTMLKSPRLKKLVEDLQNHQLVDEIIIIDNSGNLEPSLKPHPKQKYICEGRNTGCNPAWNKGVKLASNELITICNDDINFNPIILEVLDTEILDNHGIIGMGEGNFNENFNHDGNPYLEEWHPGVNDSGWGSLMFLKKSMWMHIPDDLIVWYGDNFIKEINPVKKSILRGFRVETEMSTTCDLPELSELKKQDLINWVKHCKAKIRKLEKMEKLPISIGILAWNSGQVLVDTLTTYYQNGLFDIANDITILFQEVNEQDFQIAKHFGLNFIGLKNNIGIGKGFIKLTENAETDNVLVLEHDWNLIENKDITFERLDDGIKILGKHGMHAVRYRHRQQPGHPHFSFRHKGNELNYYDNEIECTSPHLLDSVHWLNPAVEFPDKIQSVGGYFVTTSRWGNWTNNPTMYRKDFYLETVRQFAGDGIALEGNISKWWAQQSFGVAHGEGLFKHNDYIKYGK